MIEEYTEAVLALAEIDRRITVSNTLKKFGMKLPRSTGERYEFFKTNRTNIFRSSLQGENLRFPFQQIIDNIENSVIGYDLSPQAKAEFLKDFADFFED